MQIMYVRINVNDSSSAALLTHKNPQIVIRSFYLLQPLQGTSHLDCCNKQLMSNMHAFVHSLCVSTYMHTHKHTHVHDYLHFGAKTNDCRQILEAAAAATVPNKVVIIFI